MVVVNLSNFLSWRTNISYCRTKLIDPDDGYVFQTKYELKQVIRLIQIYAKVGIFAQISLVSYFHRSIFYLDDNRKINL